MVLGYLLCNVLRGFGPFGAESPIGRLDVDWRDMTSC